MMKVSYKDLRRLIPGALVSITLIATVAVLLYTSVMDNRGPEARIDASSGTVVLGRSLHFDGSGSTDPDGDDLEYLWTIDDKFTTQDVNFSFNFSSTGTHTVVLQVTDPSGEFDTDTILIDVIDGT